MHIQQLFPSLFQTNKKGKGKNHQMPFYANKPISFFFLFVGEGTFKKILVKLKKKFTQLPYYPAY